MQPHELHRAVEVPLAAAFELRLLRDVLPRRQSPEVDLDRLLQLDQVVQARHLENLAGHARAEHRGECEERRPLGCVAPGRARARVGLRTAGAVGLGAARRLLAAARLPADPLSDDWNLEALSDEGNLEARDVLNLEARIRFARAAAPQLE